MTLSPAGSLATSASGRAGFLDHLARAAAIWVLLFSVYVLSYSGRFHSIDEMSMFAVTDSLARRGEVTTNQVLWFSAFTYPTHAYGVEGQAFSKKGPLFSVLALPLHLLALAREGAGLVQGVMLLNAVLTALAGSVLYLYVARLGYSPGTGVLAALIYGLGTMAWPYAKFFFSEPLAALLLLLAAYAAHPGQAGKGRPGWAGLVSGLFLGLAAGTRIVYLAAVPLLGLYLVLSLRPSPPPSPKGRGQRGSTLSPGRLMRAEFLGEEVDSARHAPGAKAAGLSSAKPTEGAGRRSGSQIGRDVACYVSTGLSPTLEGRALRRDVVAPLAWFATGLGLALVPLAIYNFLRFASPMVTGYAENEAYSLPIWEGTLGFLASPGKSIFVYAPPVALCFYSIPRLLRRLPAEGFLIVGMLLLHLAAYGAWFMWWGGLAWGPRFLLPAVPFLVAGLAPALARGAPVLVRAVAGILLAIGVAANAPGALVSFTRTREPDHSWSAPIWDLRSSAWAEQMGLLRLPNLDLAWFHYGESSGWVDLGAILPTAILLLGATGLLAFLSLFPASARRGAMGAILALALVAFSGGAAWSAVERYYDPIGAAAKPSFPALLRTLEERGRAGDAVIYNLPYQTEWLLNYDRLGLPSYGLAQNSLDRDPALAMTLDRVLVRHPRVWLALEWTPFADPKSGVERWLDERAYKVSNEWIGEEVRLVLYSTPASPLSEAERVVGLSLGESLRLESFRLRVLSDDRTRAGSGPTPNDRPVLPVAADDVLAVELRWQAQSSVRESYKVFVHVEDDLGNILVQSDRLPQDGFRPTSTWKPGETVTDNYGLLIPATAQPGTYHVVVGLYHGETGARLPVGRGGQPLGDSVHLGDVTVSR